ncbi:ABC transporter ATP-binding protein [Paenibacillus sp. GCM10012307]|uniref:ABC transporter ATP-binding protein n=1 Tax=Paenibacillus roseus TaxID=2798579 RepID=A0A934J0S9_9BACL|nr:ABC transporter ATP-binding protein [Paenibacillus roseus]MBJ6361214.1 ABC transporter ATP-binding protein [Paenibacillus roseus]
MSVIQIENVTKSYKGTILFHEAYAVIEKGKTYGIVGPNGSGKSVLFKMICGFIKPDHGSVKIHPDYRNKHTDFPQKFGIIIDRPGYIAGKTGFENLRKLADIQNLISDKDIKNTLEQVGLQPESTQKVKHYSLGMKQKLALAQAVMENQEVLLLDEPFNGLDQDSVQNIREMLLGFKKIGKTIVLTSHNKEDIDLLCDHVFQINKYQLKQIL